jgi:hypothetical protein
MKKLSSIRSYVGVFSIFSMCCGKFVFAAPDALIDAKKKEYQRAMSLLLKNKAKKTSLNTCKKKMQGIVGSLKKSAKKGNKGLLMAEYYSSIMDVIDKIQAYRDAPTPEKEAELERIAQTYGGDINELVWYVIRSRPDQDEDK